MLKKKLGSKLTESNSVKKLPKRPPVEDLEDDEEVAVEEVEEGEEEEEEDEGTVPLPKKKLGAAKRVDDDDEEEVKPKKKATLLADKKPKKKSALAAAFASTPLSNNADDIPAGKYEAIVRDFVLQDPDAKGQSARIHFALCSPDFSESNQITQWFKLLDSDEEPVEGGIKALGASLAKLGYDMPDDEDNLEEVFQEITNEKPGVLVKVSYSKDSNGNTWQRAVIQGLCDNEVVQEYKDNVQF